MLAPKLCDVIVLALCSHSCLSVEPAGAASVSKSKNYLYLAHTAESKDGEVRQDVSFLLYTCVQVCSVWCTAHLVLVHVCSMRCIHHIWAGRELKFNLCGFPCLACLVA